MHLNQLYGIFGRKQELIETVNVHKDELFDYLKTRIIKTIIKISDDRYTLLLLNNINYDIIRNLNEIINYDFKNTDSLVKSNVAIASAVSSYARIHMSKFKNNPAFDIYYTDTDSIFIQDALPSELVGKELGLMKDELEGLLIEEAIFLGVKQYGYYYYDKNGNRIEKSTFSGVTRDSLSFEEITLLLIKSKFLIFTIK